MKPDISVQAYTHEELKTMLTPTSFLVCDQYLTPRRTKERTTVPRSPEAVVYGRFATLAEAREYQKTNGGFITEIGHQDDEGFYCKLYYDVHEAPPASPPVEQEEGPVREVESILLNELRSGNQVPVSLEVCFQHKSGLFLPIWEIPLSPSKYRGSYRLPLLIQVNAIYNTKPQDKDPNPVPRSV